MKCDSKLLACGSQVLDDSVCWGQLASPADEECGWVHGVCGRNLWRKIATLFTDSLL